MFDFRYHALSLAAVLIALMVGLLLGVAIGDAGLVSSEERKLREGLRRDVRAAQRQTDDVREDLAEARRFADAAYPLLVGGRLQGARIGLVFLGRPSDEIARHVRDAIGPTGGDVVLRAVVREPIDLGGLADQAAGTRYAAVERDRALVEPFGFRLGAQLAGGGRLIARVRSPLLRSFNGTLQPLHGVVVVRRPADVREEAQRVRDTFERGFVRGLVASAAPAVGVEMTSTEPSQVGWYRDLDLPSVDDVDQVAGRTALTFILEGDVDGAFGVKRTADALLPDVVRGRRR